MSADYASQIIRVGNWIKKNLATTLIILLIAGISYGGYVTLNHMEKIIEAVRPSARAETNSFHLSIGRGQKINALLETVREETDVSRLIVSEAHNNKVNLGSVPWNFSSARYAAISPGIAYDIDSAQNVPNTMFAEVFAQMWADPKSPKCVYLVTARIKSSLLRARLISRGTTSFIQCPIQRSDGTPLGTVVAGFVRDEPKDITSVMEKIDALAHDLAPLIGQENPK